MNEARRNDEVLRLDKAWHSELTRCRSAVASMRELLAPDQMLAVDTSSVDEAFGSSTPATSNPLPLPCFAVRA